MNNAIQNMLEKYQISSREDAEKALREILQEIVLDVWSKDYFHLWIDKLKIEEI